MYVQVVNFELDGINEVQYRQLCDELAPAFKSMDGLLSKFWLADASAGVYGGVYVWRDQQACSTYQHSKIWSDIGAHPNLVKIRSQEFELLEAPTSLTSGPFAGVRG